MQSLKKAREPQLATGLTQCVDDRPSSSSFNLDLSNSDLEQSIIGQQFCCSAVVENHSL